jgi:nicotinate-nucleotide pyrophosphorylase (carboxylating)
MNDLNNLIVAPIVAAALREDLGRAGDITSAMIIPAQSQTTAILRARAGGVISGVDCAALAFTMVDGDLQVSCNRNNGDEVKPGDVVLTISGSARSILTAERVALNFTGRLSGVATLARAYCDAVAHTNARVCDTRKTTPGLRVLEKQAVRHGGAVNHRFGLDDAVLIKDNHIAVAGSVRAALIAAKNAVGHMMAIEIEVDTLEQLEEVLSLRIAHAVLLDNMSCDALKEAVDLASKLPQKPLLEASGGVTLDSIAEIAATGVDIISAGALTHSVISLDVGLDID